MTDSEYVHSDLATRCQSYILDRLLIATHYSSSGKTTSPTLINSFYSTASSHLTIIFIVVYFSPCLFKLVVVSKNRTRKLVNCSNSPSTKGKSRTKRTLGTCGMMFAFTLNQSTLQCSALCPVMQRRDMMDGKIFQFLLHTHADIQS